jgi:hypothetical protein
VPNPANIDAPINVHGFGRSGTSLLQNILGEMGVQICNEMAGLVFGCFRGAEVMLDSDDRDITAFSDKPEVAAVRAALCAVMPSAKLRWCQKLGGLPNHVVWSMTGKDDMAYARDPFPFPYDWFWSGLRRSFPSSKDVLIVRDFRDVITSRYYYTGWHPEEIAAALAVYYNLMAHPSAKIDCVIRYEHLVTTTPNALDRLVSALGLVGQTATYEALAWHASPSHGDDLPAARRRDFCWRAKHKSVISDWAARIVAPAISRLEDRFAVDLASAS